MGDKDQEAIISDLETQVNEIEEENEQLRQDLTLARQIIDDLERGLERISQVVDEVTRDLNNDKRRFKVKV